MRRFLRGLWNAITFVRGTLANLIFLALLVFLVATLRDRPEPLPERAALRLDLTGSVVDERTRLAAGNFLLGMDAANREILLTDLIDSVDYALEDDRIAAVVMELDGLVSIGQSKVTELAAALQRFRESGKPVVAVGDYFTQDQYRLAVEADTLLMHPYGAVAIEGFGYYTNYFAEALEKLSVSVNVFRAGEYKSIAEPFLRTDMSPGEREVSAAWLGDLWRAYREAVERRRDLTDGHVDALIADYPARLRAAGGDAGQLAVREGLVDELLDRGQREAYLASLVGARDDDGGYAAVPFEAYLARQRPRALAPGTPTVAVVTAQGNMLPGENDLGAIGAETLRQLLRDTAARDDVRALVLRVTSGGGSVYAAELIREELQRLRAEGLPVVVSMGSVAASGGYYIATAADRILATPTTVTGSIGVFAAMPTFERLLARAGVYTDGVGTTSLAGGLRPDRPLAEPVVDALQQSVDRIYEKFLDLVADSRDLDRESLDAVAEGRVLSAPQALAAGLLDGLGGLDEATALAAELAGLADGSYETILMRPAVSPQQLFLQQLSEALGLRRTLFEELPLLGALLEPVRDSAALLSQQPDPRHLYVHCLVCAPGP